MIFQDLNKNDDIIDRMNEAQKRTETTLQLFRVAERTFMLSKLSRVIN